MLVMGEKKKLKDDEKERIYLYMFDFPFRAISSLVLSCQRCLFWLPSSSPVSGLCQSRHQARRLSPGR